MEMLFAERLKSLRTEIKITQNDLAQYLGVTRQAIALYEGAKREPELRSVSKIADYFNVSVDYMMGRVNSRQMFGYTVAKNIKLIRQGNTFEEFSNQIGMKTGLIISPEVLSEYENGEKSLSEHDTKIIASYVDLDPELLGNHNLKNNIDIKNNTKVF